MFLQFDFHLQDVYKRQAKQYGIEWEQKGTHEEHLDVYNFKKKERKKEVQELEPVSYTHLDVYKRQILRVRSHL